MSPSLALSLQLEGEQREWKKKVREGREREARQALLIHRLQNKVRPNSSAVLIIGVDAVGDGKYTDCGFIVGVGIQRTMSAFGASAAG